MFKYHSPILRIPALTIRTLAKNTIVCFQRLAHSFQLHAYSKALRINRLRTIRQEHPQVAAPSLFFYPSLLSAAAGLTRPDAADTIVSPAPQHFFAVPASLQGGG